MRISLALFFSVWSLLVIAQSSGDTLPVDRNFRFTDGLYADIVQLRTNRPSISFKHLAGNLVLQEEEHLLKVENLHPQGRSDLPIPLEDVDFICVNGLPYIKAYIDTARQFTVYAGLRVRGRLCYFAYTQNLADTVLIKAYNPLNGRPFRQQNVIRDKKELVEKVLNLATAEIADFNLENLLYFFADDKKLIRTLEGLSENEANERLQRCLLIYDDRNPIYLPGKAADEN